METFSDSVFFVSVASVCSVFSEVLLLWEVSVDAMVDAVSGTEGCEFLPPPIAPKIIDNTIHTTEIIRAAFESCPYYLLNYCTVSKSFIDSEIYLRLIKKLYFDLLAFEVNAVRYVYLPVIVFVLLFFIDS